MKKYKTMTELASASGLSRHQIKRAIEAGVVRPEWLWVSPGRHRKVRVEHWGQALEALASNWGHSDQALFLSDQAKRRRTSNAEFEQYISGPAGVPKKVTQRDVLEGKTGTWEDVAHAAGVTVEEVHEAVRMGRIPAHYTATEDPIPIGAAYGDVVNEIASEIHSSVLEKGESWPLEAVVSALFQLGLIWGGDLDHLERRRVCGRLSNASGNGALEGWARFDIPCEFTTIKPDADQP